MMILSIILTVVITTSLFIVRNLLKQNERLTDFITKQSEAIVACDNKLKQVDDRGIFQSDDEIGWFFKEIQTIQEALNEFTLK